MRMRQIVAKTGIFFFAAVAACHNPVLMNHKNTTEEVAGRLQATGYTELFWQTDTSTIDAIWQQGANRVALYNIVLQPEHDDETRLLASEILYAKDTGYPPEHLKEPLSFIYARALLLSGKEEGSILPGNAWGLMYYNDNNNENDYGSLGAHLIGTGLNAVPHLVRLLNESSVLVYAGSEEATIGNGLQYRVKDAVAYYIGKLKGIPVTFHQDVVARDKEIDLLKQKLHQP